MNDRDQELAWARAAQLGDRAALERLLAALYDQIHAVCRRICAQDADGEDATQHALISIVRSLDRFDGRAAVRTWAHRIAVNAALDEIRRRGRRPEPLPEPRDLADRRGGSGHGDPADLVAHRLDLDAALARLTPDFRAAVVLRDVAGMDYAEIAETLDLPSGTVRSRIARGRRQLADHLGLDDGSDGNPAAVADVVSEEP